ncbi:MAG: hypothetical protein ABJI01_08000 [Alteripontixanthobacter sp.]
MLRSTIAALAISIAFGPSGALAQDAESSGEAPGEFGALKACRDIGDDAARLACFDRAVRMVVEAEASGELRIVDKVAAEKTRRRLFGFSLPDINIFGGGDDDEEELELLQTTITSVRRIRDDAWVFQTEEGAVWQMLNVPSRNRPPKVGQPVEFKKASLGSYFIRVNSQLGVKGRRIR